MAITTKDCVARLTSGLKWKRAFKHKQADGGLVRIFISDDEQYAYVYERNSQILVAREYPTFEHLQQDLVVGAPFMEPFEMDVYDTEEQPYKQFLYLHVDVMKPSDFEFSMVEEMDDIVTRFEVSCPRLNQALAPYHWDGDWPEHWFTQFHASIGCEAENMFCIDTTPAEAVDLLVAAGFKHIEDPECVEIPRTVSAGLYLVKS